MRATSKKTLIKRQQAIDYIRDYLKANKGQSPTQNEIAFYLTNKKGNGGNIKNSIIDPLIEQGFLTVGGKWQTRTIRLASPQPRKRYYEEAE